MSKYKERKATQKQRQGEANIRRECKIEISTKPSRYLAILNAGLSNGLTEEKLLQAALLHGDIADIILLPGKSYCFLECDTVEQAESVFNGMHNVAKIGQNNAVIFLTYVEELPSCAAEKVWAKPMPPGLVSIPDIITEAEAEQFLLAIKRDNAGLEDENSNASLKHRRVQHFGYEFNYDTNNVDATRPLEQKIPAICDILWRRVALAAAEFGLQLEWQVPDQLTVNEYEPGQGIPPHIDTHSAFLDPIISLSLESDIVMDFRMGDERSPLILQSRSILIMSGESRYAWTHGITPRHFDVVPSVKGLTTEARKKRTSFTFRKLRNGPCNCNFPSFCDTRLLQSTADISANSDLSKVAVELEEKNVHNVYEEIATHFSETRHSPWPQVAAFLKSLEPGSVVLDVGCGNGKYLNCAQDGLVMGCDRSNGLLEVCAASKKFVFRCDCLNLPIRSNSMDACISIAVIHHLATPERRLAAVREMARILRTGGQGLIYVWAKNQRSDAKKSSYLLQNKAINKHKSTEEQQRQTTAQHELVSETPANLPVHTNRTDFRHQDILVPWKLKDPVPDDNKHNTFLRYYHVFEENELSELILQVPELCVVRNYYDQGNYCVIFQRK